MATLIIQNDGGSISNANAYIDIAFADTYHDNRGNAVWATKTDQEKIVGIIRGRDYIDYRNEDFFGAVLTAVQNTEWPRIDIFDKLGNLAVGIIDDIKKANAEYALRAVVVDLAPDIETDPTGQRIASKSDRVDVISESISYSTSSAVRTFRKYPQADYYIRPYIIQAGTLTRI